MPSTREADSEGIPSGMHPARLTPLHHEHLSLGAKMTEWQGWLLPESYRGPDAEVKAALESVGLAEESANTKIDIKGNEVDGFARSLGVKPAPIRAGQVSFRPPSVEWDGVPVRHLCRLAKDHAFMVLDGSKSLSANSPIRVESRGAPTLNVRLTNVSSVFAGVTLVGPMTSRVLRKLTDLEISSEAPQGAACAEGPVADVQTLLIRSGAPLGGVRVDFSELYFSRDYAEYFWSAMMEAGREYGLVPIGTTALRSIRSRISWGPHPEGGTA